jgi:Glycosyl transferase family 2
MRQLYARRSMRDGVPVPQNPGRQGHVASRPRSPGRPVCQAEPVLPLLAACAVTVAAWAYLLAGHGGYWRTDQRLPAAAAEPRHWPGVVAIVPARDEAAVLPGTLPALLAQDYPGAFDVVLVDDESSDGTAQVAAALGRAAEGSEDRAGRPDRGLRIVSGAGTPAGWAGKVWAMAQGLQAAGDAEYVLFTDADIACRPGSLATLVRAAEADDRALLSQMALLRADTGWERLLVPAFVYFFAQLYPFRRVNRPGARTAAAAGGCMLIRRRELAAAGGLAGIRGALIDDVALGQLMKGQPVNGRLPKGRLPKGRLPKGRLPKGQPMMGRLSKEQPTKGQPTKASPSAGRCWLGLTTDITSIRPYPRLADVWDMVARSAYTQLRYSPAALAGTVVGLLWLYVLPPAAAVGGVLGLAAGGGAWLGWLAAAGLVSWALMTMTYVPMLRLYRLSPLRAPCLPLIAVLYAAMTADSARRHYRGRGGEWKGRPHGRQGAALGQRP